MPTDTYTRMRKVKFEVGHRVVMSGIGKRKFDDCASNPHDIYGVITQIFSPYWIIVRWNNCIENLYSSTEIDHLMPQTQNQYPARD